ncbi:protein NLRC3-like [Dysidea avara]|uniref:protein NLRC3-like n=1 Tax=Dysidea avara TaxID=196820 RepID=UPI0033173959
MISEVIRVNATLQKLDVSNCGISDSGIVAISKSLKYNNTLQELNMSLNEINEIDEIVEVIEGNTVLRKLDISCCGISDSGIVAISKSLKYNNTLQELNMSYNEINEINEIVEVIEGNTTLRKLDISYCGIRSKMAVIVSESYKNNKTLQEFIISWKNDQVTVRTADIFYNLSNKKIGDIGALIVSNLLYNSTRVNKLDVSYNKISHKGIVFIADYLKNNITLQKLNISHNSIAIEGAKKIAEIIQINRSLQNLNISYCSIPDRGIVTICNFLSNNTTLQELNMSHNEIMSTGAKKIAEVIQLNTTLLKLDISSCGIPDSGALVISKSYISAVLKEIKISWKSNHVTINTAESVWDLSRKNIGDTGAQIVSNFLCNNVEIKELYVSHNNISDYRALAFDVDKAYKVDRLMYSETLLELHMSHNNITLKGANNIAELINVNTILQTLDISHCGIPDDGALVISKSYKNNKTLQELIISWNNDKVTVNTVDTFWNISRKKIGNIGVYILVNLLNSRVIKLDVSHNSISEEGVVLISDYFMSQHSIEELNLSYNIITTKGADKIGDFIKINCTLQKLNLSYCGMLEGDAVTISESYKINKTLQKSVQYYHKYNEPLQELVISWGDDKFVITTSTLCCDVSGMKIGNTGALILSNLLSVNCHLIKLDISRNGLCDDEILIISNCLRSNLKLEDLGMSRNNVTDRGLAKVFCALKYNAALKTIDISFNCLSNNAALTISEFIMEHRTLKRCNLSGNDITALGKKNILDSTNGSRCHTKF